MGRLTVRKINALTTPGLYGDEPTLYLRVAPGGSKSWVQRLTVDGKQSDMGLGGWPLTTIAEARDKALENRRKARRGEDPAEERRRARAEKKSRAEIPTFREAALATLAKERGKWKGARTARSWIVSMERYVFPRIGDKQVHDIRQRDVLAVVNDAIAARPETGRKVRSRIRQVLGWAMANEFVTQNVAGEAIDHGVTSVGKDTRHHPAVHHADVGQMYEAIGASGAAQCTKLALMYLILTAARTREVIDAEWSEIDLKTAMWIIPGSRMKSREEHRVPLSDEAMSVLRNARRLNGGDSRLVFPSPFGERPLSGGVLLKTLRAMGYRETVHGFRSSFRTWASEKTNAAHAVMELSLAHRVGSAVEQAYARGDLFDKRRTLMDEWAKHVVSGGSGGNKIVRLPIRA